MGGAHRQDDKRTCGATTIVSGQSTVFVNGKLWAVEGDLDSHGHGDLVSVIGSTVKINGKKVIVYGDHANSDDAGHTMPYPQDKSSNVNAQ